MDELQRLEVYAQIVAERAWLGLDSRERAADLINQVLLRIRDPGGVPFVLLWMHKLRLTPAIPGSPHLIEPIRLQIEGHWSEAADARRATGATFFEGLALSNGDAEARQQAVRLFQDIGAYATIKAAQAEMRRDGMPVTLAGPRKSTLENPAGLTRRQMDVLKAQNDGLSNTEIASKHFIFHKTVDHHVSAILPRLDASTRGEAAAKARKAGLIQRKPATAAAPERLLTRPVL
jgi:DNA-binding CsgD family transcriptional regulator